MDNGWLKLRNVPPDRAKGLAEIDPSSVAYSLDPGRVFIRVRGREKDGCVSPGADYEALRDEIAAAALQLRDPDSDDPFFQSAFQSEELYHGPHVAQAADLILAPYDGYDPKGALYRDSLTDRGDELVGMHTHDDAMLYIGEHKIPQAEVSVLDVLPTILDLMGVPHPQDLDGQSLL
jgi:predicted AlkP superfamily phosphohydrolase/phosphomutase